VKSKNPRYVLARWQIRIARRYVGIEPKPKTLHAPGSMPTLRVEFYRIVGEDFGYITRVIAHKQITIRRHFVALRHERKRAPARVPTPALDRASR